MDIYKVDVFRKQDLPVLGLDLLMVQYAMPHRVISSRKANI
jgi:hypothetical protein